ncbi:uncharacterized RNA-binding protein C4F6.14-like isoform X1 [Tetranychus urticae]|uniref:uncharacterized RNA-binding protein C4F6.14-like isoform X1 n=1 Tax=Tetranychus urticae TaxID=32264 RepID=UPI000D652912|nr:uncharacterized RNA-binding protein C4F6.14-like isoform X1 [Tetranychus urticae]
MPRSGGGDGIANKSLFIKNLSEDIRSNDLKNIFGKYGKIADVYIPVDYYNRKPRGFAYVQFESLRDAKDAVRDLQHLTFHGRELTVEFAQGDRKSKSSKDGLIQRELLNKTVIHNPQIHIVLQNFKEPKELRQRCDTKKDEHRTSVGIADTMVTEEGLENVAGVAQEADLEVDHGKEGLVEVQFVVTLDRHVALAHYQGHVQNMVLVAFIITIDTYTGLVKSPLFELIKSH